ncbi:hypothetical protein COCMIDRAFT_101449, partial [Bipolaris oryzae ATCC 44560]
TKHRYAQRTPCTRDMEAVQHCEIDTAPPLCPSCMPTPTEDIVAREHTNRSKMNTSALGYTMQRTLVTERSSAAVSEITQEEQKLI